MPRKNFKATHRCKSFLRRNQSARFKIWKKKIFIGCETTFVWQIVCGWQGATIYFGIKFCPFCGKKLE